MSRPQRSGRSEGNVKIVRSRDMGFFFGVRRAVHMMIVVGGHNSANIRHLADLSRDKTASASTPDFSIDQVVRRIEAIGAFT